MKTARRSRNADLDLLEVENPRGTIVSQKKLEDMIETCRKGSNASNEIFPKCFDSSQPSTRAITSYSLPRPLICQRKTSRESSQEALSL